MGYGKILKQIVVGEELEIGNEYWVFPTDIVAILTDLGLTLDDIPDIFLDTANDGQQYYFAKLGDDFPQDVHDKLLEKGMIHYFDYVDSKSQIYDL